MASVYFVYLFLSCVSQIINIHLIFLCVNVLNTVCLVANIGFIFKIVIQICRNVGEINLCFSSFVFNECHGEYPQWRSQKHIVQLLAEEKVSIFFKRLHYEFMQYLLLVQEVI